MPRRGIARRLAAAALSTAAIAAGTAGCSTLHPGAAAVVGSQSIDVATVDDVASAYCAVISAAEREQGSPSTHQPTRDLRRGVLNALVQSSVVTAAARRVGGIRITEAEVRDLVDAGAPLPATAPSGDTETVRRFLDGVARTQLMLREIGERLLAKKSAGGQPSSDRAVAAGQRYVAGFASRLDVSVDPRYGSYSAQGIGVGSGSLSVPVSNEAKSAVRTTVEATPAANLPASQTCS